MAGVAGLAAVTVIAACSDSSTEQGTSASPRAPQSSSAVPAAAHNQADMMFARMMIPHHRQAIEMSDMILGKQGIDSRVVDLAKQIKAAQDPEIKQMQGWLDQWGMGDMPGLDDMPGDHAGMPGMSGMPVMEGMMSPADMQALKDAQGVAAARLFLTGMIKHHQGAIIMAQNEIRNGQFADTIALAKSIAASQQKEIDAMNEILRSL